MFSVTCTARAEVDGESVPLVIEWFIIPIHPSFNTSKVESTLYNTTWSPGGGYQSVLTTSENGTFNTIIYHCIASNDNVSAYSNTTVTIEGMCQANNNDNKYSSILQI